MGVSPTPSPRIKKSLLNRMHPRDRLRTPLLTSASLNTSVQRHNIWWNDETDSLTIILFAYSLVCKLAVSVETRPNWVRKLNARPPLRQTIVISNVNARAQQQASKYLSFEYGAKQEAKAATEPHNRPFLESGKHRKVVGYENQRKREILRRQREEDYWDENEDFSLDSSSEEPDGNESSPDQPSSDREEENVIEDSKGGEDIREGLVDDEGGVQLEIEKRTFKPRWKSDAGGYLRGVRGCSSSATETLEKRRKKELEKSAFYTRSTTDMFSV